MRCVDGVYLSTDKDASVLGTLKHVLVQNQANGRNHFMFCNGGDRSNTNTPEERLCSSNSYNLTSVYNVGGNKAESSSVLINNAAKMQRESQDELKKRIESAGFKSVKYKNLFNGIVAIHSGWKE